MKKKILSLLLLAAIVLTFVQGASFKAFAADTPVLYVGGMEISNPTNATTYASDVSWSNQAGCFTGGVSYRYDSTNNKGILTLTGAAITGGYSYLTYALSGIVANFPLELVLINTNSIAIAPTIDNYSVAGIKTLSTLTVSGTGSLTVTATEANANYGFSVNGNLIINSGTITVTLGASTAGSFGSNAFYCQGNITVNGGTINLSAGNAANSSIGVYTPNGRLTMNGGTLVASAGTGKVSAGIFASLTMNGGTLTATSTTGTTSSCALYYGVIFAAGYSGIASTNTDGSTPVNYVAANNSSYKYVKLFKTTAFSSLSANGSDSATTTELTLTFDADIADFSVADITVTNATKGTLTKQSGTGVYKLTITDISVLDEEIVYVSVSKTGVIFSVPTKSVAVRVIDSTANHSITNGTNSRWANGSTGSLSFTSDGAYGNYSKTLIDGVQVAPVYLTVTEGSTIVAVKPEFLQTLSVGAHTLRIVHQDGYAETSFTVTANVPATGSTSAAWLWLATATVALAGAAILLFALKRKQRA